MKNQTIPHRSQVPPDDQWDLTPLFADDPAWEALFAQVKADIHGYQRFQGRLGASAEELKAAIEFDLGLSRNLEKLYTYAHLKSDQDRGDQGRLAMFQRSVSLMTAAGEAASFLEPEILAIDPERMAGFLARDEFTELRFHLEKMLRRRPHTLGTEMEHLLAMTRETTRVPWETFGQLDNVDLRFGTLTDAAGQTMELSHANFATFLQSGDRQVRKRAFFQYYESYEAHRNTLAAMLAGSVKNDRFYARARRFSTCRERALFEDNIPGRVYDNLIATVRARLQPLFRYLDLRKTALGLDRLHFYDTYVPLVPRIQFQLPYEEAVALCQAALTPLGEGYTRTLVRGLREGWVDRYENRGKRSGAYSAGCYDSPPYILLNYEAADLGSLYTLIHEAGHSMHSYFSWRAQPYVYHGYTIFVAEVASTFNEILLSRHLLQRHADDPRMQAHVLNREIDNLHATLFRQTMFAEFELKLHGMAENDQPLTLAAMTECYRQLLEAYFGGHVALDEALSLEYLRIPHFYSAFYVYKYATGISAAVALAQRVLQQDPAAVAAYLAFLESGSSRFPLQQLAQAGVDMSSADPIEQAVAYFSDLVDQLEQVMTKLS